MAFATRAAEKLRQQGLVAEALQVFVQTNRFRTDEPQYANAATCERAPPTNDTFDLIAAATAVARRLWRNGFRYAKAGVILSGLTPQDRVQLFLLDARGACSAKLMAAMDAVNTKMGRGTLAPASVAVDRGGWRMKQDKRSPRYTTCLDELPVVRACPWVPPGHLRLRRATVNG